MKTDFDLRRLLDAAGITIERLAVTTGIDNSTLSRACNGYRLSPEKQRRIAGALADPLKRQTREVARAKRTVARITNAVAVA